MEKNKTVNDKIQVKPWVEVNKRRNEYSIGIQMKMSIAKMMELLNKLKLWKTK